MSEKQNHDNAYPTRARLLTTELQFPVSYLDRLLRNDQRDQRQNSSRDDFLLTMLDCLTDYILEMVGTEANNGSIVAQDMEGAVDNNREPQRRLNNTAFTLLDEMPGARKSG